MATVQTLGNIHDQNSNDIENKTFYNRTLLERLTPNLAFVKYGQKKSYKKNEGKSVNFRRFNKLAPALTPLVEGVEPNGSNISVTSITATVEQYGDFVPVSDIVDTVGIDPVVTETTEVLADQASETIETVIAEIVAAGTNVQYAGGAASRQNINTSTGKISAAEIKKAVRTLKNGDAKAYEDGYFIGFIDPDLAYDIQNDALWQDVSKYNGGANIEKGEIGKLGGVKFIETTLLPKKPIFAKTSDQSLTAGKTYYTLSDGVYSKVASPSAGSLGSYYGVAAYAHQCLIFGKDAYGVVDVAGSTRPEVIVKAGNETGGALNQFSTIGWKALFTAVRLTEDALVRLEAVASN